MPEKTCNVETGFVGMDAQGCLLLSGSKDGQGMVLDSNNNVYVPAGDFEVSHGNLELPNGNLKVFNDVNITNGALNVLNGSLSVSGNSNLNGPVKVSDGDLEVSKGNLRVFSHLNISNGALNVLNGSLSVSGNSNLNGPVKVSDGDLEVSKGNLRVFSHVNISNGALSVLNGSINVPNGNLSVSGNSDLNGSVKVSDGDLEVTNGCFTAPQQPFFSAFLSSNQMSQTGAGALAKFIPDTVNYNVGGGYNSSSGDFTAPKTGLYWLACKITVGVAQGTTRRTDLVDKLRMTVAEQLHIKYWSSSSFFDGRPTTREMFGAYYMNAGDIANCAMQVHQVGENAVFFWGDFATQMSVLSGHLLH